jgi:hypothetical protein
MPGKSLIDVFIYLFAHGCLHVYVSALACECVLVCFCCVGVRVCASTRVYVHLIIRNETKKMALLAINTNTMA